MFASPSTRSKLKKVISKSVWFSGARYSSAVRFGSAMEVCEVDIASGKHTLWKSIAAPVGSTGVSHVYAVRIAPDCQSAVWSVETRESRLFLVRGVQ